MILLCGKCAKRHPDGKALRRALKQDVSRRGREAKGKHKPRLIKTACLGLCPKNAVVVASGATLSRSEVILLRDRRDVAGAMLQLLAATAAD